MSPTFNEEKHIERHKELHNNLDELITDMITQKEILPGKTSLIDFMKWSKKQTVKPDLKEEK